MNIFRLNVKLHPDSPNTCDSLAEAYLTTGDKTNARKYYKLAVEKNIGRTDAEKRILENSRNRLMELDQ